jgi:hypothetical protein
MKKSLFGLFVVFVIVSPYTAQAKEVETEGDHACCRRWTRSLAGNNLYVGGTPVNKPLEADLDVKKARRLK